MSATVATTLTHNGIDYLAEVGTIESTSLGYEDHGIFTAWLMMKFTGSGQGAGGYALDTFDEAADSRVGTKFGMDFIIAVMRAVGAREWEQIKGRTIYVLRTEPYGSIVGISDLRGENVLIFTAVQP